MAESRASRKARSMQAAQFKRLVDESQALKAQLQAGAKIVPLRDQMSALVKRVQFYVKQDAQQDREARDPHYHACAGVAREYNLASGKFAFPLWLSRIVEGVIRDLDENNYDV